jgi:hypothetical protein
MVCRQYALFLSTIFLTILGANLSLMGAPARGVAVNNKVIKQDNLVIDTPFINNGDIEVSTMLVDADFKNRDGFVEADKVFVTASCNTFENNNTLHVSDNLTFVDPKTRIIFSIMTRVNALYKGDDYMGGIDCWFGKKSTGTLTITNNGQAYAFEGSAEAVKDALNKGLNTTYNVTALIAYLRQYLTQKHLVATALRR